MAGAAVARDVGQRFLGDAIVRLLYVESSEPLALRAKVNSNPGALDHSSAYARSMPIRPLLATPPAQRPDQVD